jgi:hypothetical protein
MVAQVVVTATVVLVDVVAMVPWQPVVVVGEQDLLEVLAVLVDLVMQLFVGGNL